MTYQYILTEVEDSILTIIINRPKKLNALNAKVIQEIGNAVMASKDDDSVSGIIITGSGEKAFVAGADISEFATYELAEAKKLSSDGHQVFNSIERFSKPIIAAVNGFSLGGGCELAMACHIRVASDNARFGQPEVNLGVIPGYGGTQRLIQLIGKSKALEYLMTGDMIKSDEALKLGLVNHVVPMEHLLSTSRDLLKKISTKGPNAISKVIEAANAFYEKDSDGFQKEIDLFGECFGTPEFIEGTTAFMEKRKAEFRHS